MTWYAWAMIALLVLSTAAGILTVGRPRKPLTPGLAVWMCVFNGLYVWGICSLAS